MSGGNSIDALIAMQQIREKNHKEQQKLYFCFGDLEKRRITGYPETLPFVCTGAIENKGVPGNPNT